MDDDGIGEIAISLLQLSLYPDLDSLIEMIGEMEMPVLQRVLLSTVTIGGSIASAYATTIELTPDEYFDLLRSTLT